MTLLHDQKVASPGKPARKAREISDATFEMLQKHGMPYNKIQVIFATTVTSNYEASGKSAMSKKSVVN